MIGHEANADTRTLRKHQKLLDSQESELPEHGLWISEAYATYYKVGAGDFVMVDTGMGAKSQVLIEGVFRYCLTHHEAIMGPERDAPLSLLLPSHPSPILVVPARAFKGGDNGTYQSSHQRKWASAR